MICAIDIKDPLHIGKEVPCFYARDGLTLRELLVEMNPGFVAFDVATIVLVDSTPWLVEDWDTVLPDNCKVALVMLPGTWEWIVVYLVILIVSVVLALVLTPSAVSANNNLSNGESVYTLSGQRNQIKLNDPIESAYGRNRIYPAYAARPYNVYKGNQQFQYSLYCLGHGDHGIEDMLFEDTPLEQFDDVEFQIVGPGEELTLFSDNVDTSSAVANIELFGPNEAEFPGWSGGFVVNEANTLANRIEVDISLPAGLYYANDTGGLSAQAVEASFEYREINDAGDALGDWTPLVFSEKKVRRWTTADYVAQGFGIPRKPTYDITVLPTFYKSLATTTPQRFTLGLDVTPARYEVRGKRVNNKNTSHRVGNTLRWESLRAFFPSVRNYGNITLVAIAARASNNLNNNAAQKFNVISTRMLPTWAVGTGWSTPVETRNPVWAFCDIFRAVYGGRLPWTMLDMEELYTLSVLFDEEDTHFDYIYDKHSTLWDAARLPARIGRGIPMLTGSQITMVRDEVKIAATGVFGPNNIVRGSFSWNVKLVNVEENDGLEIQYLDADTWKEETVQCLIGDDLGTKPRSLRLPGCSDRTRAFHEGLYIRATELLVRENIEFDTGLEGQIPRYGDLILVNHDVPRWGQTGLLKELNGPLATLSHAVTFTPGETHVIILRKKDGSSYGPFTVTATDDPLVVALEESLNADNFYFDDVHELPYFSFGQPNVEAKRCIVVGVTPKNEEIVTIKCSAYVPAVFSYTDLPTPPRGAFNLAITNPDRPVVKSIKVSAIPDTPEFILASWPPALGAKNYVLEESPDGENWNRSTTIPSTVAQLHVYASQLYLRVAGVNVDIGPWVSWSGRVGDVVAVPGTVLTLAVVLNGNGYTDFSWAVLTNIDRYQVTVFEAVTLRFLRREETDLTTFQYTWANALADGLVGGDIVLNVVGMNILGVSVTAATVTTYVTEPSP